MKTKKPIRDPLAAFAAPLREQGRSARTVGGYLDDLRVFARWFEQTNGESLTPEALTSTDAREYRQHLLKQKAAPSTINRKLASLRAYTAWGRAAGLTDAHPLNGIPPVEQQRLAPKWLAKKEQAALLREAEGEINAAQTEAGKRKAIRDRALIVVLLNTGLRVGELCNLQLDDLTLSERKGKLRVRQGKGEKSRDVPLNAAALSALREWLEARPEAEEAWLFVGKGGVRLESRGVQRMLAETARRAGIGRAAARGGSPLTPHTLRHTFANKNLVNAGVTLEKVAALLGHASLNTTRIYTTPSEQDLEQAVAQVG